MMQLNSYRNERYKSWKKKNRAQLREPAVTRMLFGTWLVIAGVLMQRLPLTDTVKRSVAYALTGFVLIWAARVFFARKEEKKAFVITARVKRLFAMSAIALTLAAALSVVLAFVLLRRDVAARGLCAGGILMLALPPALLPPISILMTAPRENRIAQGFVSEATDKLNSQKPIVVGITGSFGKTSFKYVLTSLLSERYNTLMTPESYNTTMGVVRTINEQLRPWHEVFVCEMGARQKGDIVEICDIVKPQYGVVTAIGSTHLETFLTEENILNTKFELPNSLPDNGMAFLNTDSKPVRMYGYSRPCITYGLEGDPDYRASDISYSEQGATFTLHIRSGETMRLTTRLLGRHNVLNVTGAVAVALELGVTPLQVTHALIRIQAVPHRLEMKYSGDLIILDDAYNANPEGAAEALVVLGSLQGRTRILLTPGIVELGASEAEENRALGALAALHCDHIIAVGGLAEYILQGALSTGFDRKRCVAVKNLKEAQSLLPYLTIEPAVLLLINDLADDLELKSDS